MWTFSPTYDERRWTAMQYAFHSNASNRVNALKPAILIESEWEGGTEFRIGLYSCIRNGISNRYCNATHLFHCRWLRQVVVVFSIRSLLLGWMHFHSFAQFTIFCAPIDLCKITARLASYRSSICSTTGQRHNGHDTTNQMNEVECRMPNTTKPNRKKRAQK